jgi:hypothetical protein
MTPNSQFLSQWRLYIYAVYLKSRALAEVEHGLHTR